MTHGITILDDGAGIKALTAHLFETAAAVPGARVGLVTPARSTSVAIRDALAWIDTNADAVRSVSWPYRRVRMANGARLELLGLLADDELGTAYRWGGLELDVIGIAGVGLLEPAAVEYLTHRQRTTDPAIDDALADAPRLVGTLAL